MTEASIESDGIDVFVVYNERNMTARRFPPPWSVDELEACSQCEFWKMSKTMMIAPRTIIQLEI